MPINKLFSSAAAAVADIFDGAVVLTDGFGGPGGMPQELILALRQKGVKNLTIATNSGGLEGFGSPGRRRQVTHGILIENGQVSKLIASYPAGAVPSRPSAFERAYLSGKFQMELELVPQGTLAERIRAGGAGIAAFYTPTGVGTDIAKGKETRAFNGKEYLLEHALSGDFAIIRAHKADTLGNLAYRGSSRNFNAVMATAAKMVIAEVNEIVEPGGLDPEMVHTPGIYVDRIVKRVRPEVIYLEDVGL